MDHHTRHLNSGCRRRRDPLGGPRGCFKARHRGSRAFGSGVDHAAGQPRSGAAGRARRRARLVLVAAATGPRPGAYGGRRGRRRPRAGGHGQPRADAEFGGCASDRVAAGAACNRDRRHLEKPRRRASPAGLARLRCSRRSTSGFAVAHREPGRAAPGRRVGPPTVLGRPPALGQRRLRAKPAAVSAIAEAPTASGYRTRRNWAEPLLGAALVLPLAVFAWTGTYSRYTADDFCWAGILQTQGFFGS